MPFYPVPSNPYYFVLDAGKKLSVSVRFECANENAMSLALHGSAQPLFGCNSHTGTPREFTYENRGGDLGMLVHAGFKDGPPNPNLPWRDSAYRFRQQSNYHIIWEYEDGTGDGDFNDCVIEMSISG